MGYESSGAADRRMGALTDHPPRPRRGHPAGRPARRVRDGRVVDRSPTDALLASASHRYTVSLMVAALDRPAGPRSRTHRRHPTPRLSTGCGPPIATAVAGRWPSTTSRFPPPRRVRRPGGRLGLGQEHDSPGDRQPAPGCRGRRPPRRCRAAAVARRRAVEQGAGVQLVPQDSSGSLNPRRSVRATVVRRCAARRASTGGPPPPRSSACWIGSASGRGWPTATRAS